MNDFEPIDLDERMNLRDALLAAWEAWEEMPGNDGRAKAMVDACVAYCGDAHNDFRKYASAVLRSGADRALALQLWEGDW